MAVPTGDGVNDVGKLPARNGRGIEDVLVSEGHASESPKPAQNAVKASSVAGQKREGRVPRVCIHRRGNWPHTPTTRICASGYCVKCQDMTVPCPPPFNTRTPQILPRDARDAIEAVFDALSNGVTKIGASTERYSETALDKMADAARALGWPKELVDASHKHLLQASKAQMQTIDQLMDAWKKQLTAPEANQFMAQLRALPGASFDAMPGSSPLHLWMQTAEMWQRNWQSAMSMWTSGSSRPH